MREQDAIACDCYFICARVKVWMLWTLGRAASWEDVLKIPYASTGGFETRDEEGEQKASSLQGSQQEVESEYKLLR